MTTYDYVVIDKSGKQKKGSMDANDSEKVKEVLKADGLIPITIKEQNFLSKDISIGKKRVKARDLAVFCRQFGSILAAGVPVISALQMLTDQTENKNLRAAIKEVQLDVEKGETLAGAMRNQNEIFPPMLINMIEAGEASGSLEISLSRMSVHFEKDAKLQATVKKALVYPAVVLTVAIAVIIIMLVVVIPQFQEMFEEVGSDLPAMTLMIVGMSNAIRSFWWLFLLIIICIGVAINTYRKTPNGERLFSKIALTMPLFGSLTIKSSSARLARTLSTLMAAGIPLIDAVEITSRIMSNAIVRQCLDDTKEEVSRGVPLSTPLQESGLFPAMVHHMTKIGEETGNVEGMLEKVADYYDEEVENATEALMSIMEPLIIVLLAVIVGFILLAIYTPMLKLYDAIDNG